MNMIKCQDTWEFQKVLYFHNVLSFRRVNKLDVEVMFIAKLSMSNIKFFFFTGYKRADDDIRKMIQCQDI